MTSAPVARHARAIRPRRIGMATLRHVPTMAATLLLALPCLAIDLSYTWWNQEPSGTIRASSTRSYPTYESAVRAARAAGGGFWRYVEPVADPFHLWNPFHPVNQYWAGYSYVDRSLVFGPTVEAACRAIWATRPLSRFTGPIVPWYPETFYDYWACEGQVCQEDGRCGTAREHADPWNDRMAIGFSNYSNFGGRDMLDS